MQTATTTANPQPAFEPPKMLATKYLKPNRAMAKSAAQAVGREVLWTGNVFLFLTFSIFVARMASKIINQFLPENLWEKAPDLLREVGGMPASQSAAKEEAFEAEEIMVDGVKLYRHNRRYMNQEWPCPLLKPTACQGCEFFIEGEGMHGRYYCAAIIKLRTRHVDKMRGIDLKDLRDQIRDNARMNGGSWQL